MEIYMTKDMELRQQILQKLKDNNGYCPCRLTKTPETKCMCKDFKEQTEGTCHCGLYIKTNN